MRARTSLLLFAAASAAAASTGSAQIRVVSLNPYNGDSDIAQPRAPWINTILAAIGTSVSDDPFIAGNTGIAKPIDVLALQEVYSAETTVKGFRNIMNALYPGANYQYGTIDGATNGAGTQGIVYNANAVTLVATKKIGVTSGSGQPRQALRYQLRPVGYGESADMYMYNVHYKAGHEDVEPNAPARRQVESLAIRADSDALGPGKNILYTGDFNVYHDYEAAVQTLIAPGNGQALDPINKIGDWHENVSFKAAHTQSPYSAATAASLGTGFTIGATGGMDDRFDLQWVTANLLDGNGLAYIPNSYQAFGNNGSHTSTSMNQPINSSSNNAQPRNVLDAMAGVLDHLPVVADYQIPAKMSASLSAVPTQVIVGANINATLSVSNSAPVTFAIGADALAYSYIAGGAGTGSGSGSDMALGAANSHTIALTTASSGPKTASVVVNSTSESVANSNFSQAINYTVLDHAAPSFSASDDAFQQAVDFGYVPVGSASRQAALAIHNRAATYRARLDVTAVNGSGDTARLATSATPFTNLAAGQSSGVALTLDASAVADLAATHTFSTSDQNLPGAIVRPTLTLISAARVFSVATFPVTGFMYLPANEPLTTGPFGIAAGVTLTKTGPGAMTINGPQANAAGSRLVIDGGAVTFQTSGGPNLSVNVNTGGSARFESAQQLHSIAVSGTGKLDITSNRVTLQTGSVGSWTGSAYTDLSGLIAAGRNGGTWNGSGIITTEPAALNDLTTVGISADGSNVVLMYTYAGDSNLDGQINADDYANIDFNAPLIGAAGYANGDFNYDGQINSDDYALIDFNVNAQGAPFPTSAALTVAVPEPIGLLPLLVVALIAPQRRRGRGERQFN